MKAIAMTHLLAVVPLAVLLGCTSYAADKATSEPSNSIKIRLKIGESEIFATLRNSATAKDFVSLLPLKLTLNDYGKTEKISDLPKRLTTEGAPSGSDPSIGDIAYYAPWGNLALFYKDFDYSSGLIIMGKIDSSVEILNVAGPLNVTIEAVD